MADDKRSKRLKTTFGAGGENANDDAKNALRSENASVRQENSPLRQLLQGNREALPVSTLTVVDLSRVDTSLITQIASFVGTSRELLNLALSCKSFGWQQPATGLDWSLAEEVARQAVCSGQNDLEGVRRTSLPQYVGGTTTWLSILHKSEHRALKFDTLLGSEIVHFSGDRSFVRGTNLDCSGTAVASNYVMESGIHFAEFYIVGGHPYIGIARPMPNLDPARFVNNLRIFGFFNNNLYGDFLTARTDKWGDGNVRVCQYCSMNGAMNWTNWDGEGGVEGGIDWDGMAWSCEGDTIGMLLNLDEGTLTVYKNNRRLGVMKDGLSGSYCWHATMLEVSAISIKRSDARNPFVIDEVIKVICNLSTDSRNELGVHVGNILRQVPLKSFSETDIRNAISYLYKKGHIISTIDGDHYLYKD